MNYSQRGEQEVILRVFGDFVGRFLEIGAFNGKMFSNTLALVERGWSGVCVEPSPKPFGALQDLHGANDRISLINAAVVLDGDGLLPFWDSLGDAISTSEDAHYTIWKGKGAKNYQRIWVGTITVDGLLGTFPAPYDFVNIDTEGTSAEIALAMIPKLSPRLWCIEHDRRVYDLKKALPGYREVWLGGENLIMERPCEES